ncbi:hypothetical protein [Ovoidimarina sediminis]|uniref:hypothetical protein n=1 Tax=Ovoidimarina sediminis TaxID=3079856 RepID=UPI0029115C6D|nr:hypothetical protein [Rhodophyticola sp. MJ-SS7]MDU8946637.1 hypothetical protein [Rhodophyticola sp. MJ-SS7]
MGKSGILAAAILALGATAAGAGDDPAAPNLSADFGQTGSAEEKLDRMNSAFGTHYETVGGMMSDHVKSYEDVGPGRSGLAPLSDKANSQAE